VIRELSFKKLRRSAAERRGLAGDARQANFEERTLLASWLELGEWRLPGIGEAMKLVDCLLRQPPEFRGEYDVTAAFALSMKHRPAWNRDVEHFLQAKRLRAELGIVILELSAFALFIFHWQESAVGVLFDHVTFAGQTKPVGENGQRAKERHVLGDLVTWQVGVFMDNVAANSVLVFRPPAFNDLQPRPARAVEVVVEQRKRQRLDLLNFGGW